MRRLVVHVGYPKAASTTLQNTLFLDLHRKGRINFLGRAWESGYYGDHANIASYKEWLGKLIRHANQGGLGRESGIPLPRLSETTVNVLSEGLLMANENHSTDVVVPRLIQEVFSPIADDIRILMVIRNQQSLLLSYFIQNHQKLPHKVFKNFLQGGVQSGWTGRYKIFHFDRIAAEYAQVFGPEKVKIVLFEKLLDSRESFASDLASAMGIEPIQDAPLLGGGHLNATGRGSGYKVVKKTNIFTPRGLAKKALSYIPFCGDKWLNIKIPDLTADEQKEIFEIFKEGNRRLVDRFGVDPEVMRRHEYF